MTNEPARPQTLGEEIPEGVLELIEKHRGYQAMRDERGMTGVLPVVWLADENARLVEALEEAEQAVRERNVELTMQDTNLKVFREALEQKEQELTLADRNIEALGRYYDGDRTGLVKEIQELKSTVARQQEELASLRNLSERLNHENAQLAAKVERGQFALGESMKSESES